LAFAIHQERETITVEIANESAATVQRCCMSLLLLIQLGRRRLLHHQGPCIVHVIPSSPEAPVSAAANVKI